jgi:hypothetical protein
MRGLCLAAAALFAFGGPVPALLLLALAAGVHVVRSPDRMLDAAVIGAFLGFGLLFG